MKQLLTAIKVTLLLGALFVLAWSAAPATSTALHTMCEGKGDTCAIITDDKIHYYKEVD